MRNIVTLIEFGNREITLTIGASREWEKNGNRRVYFDVESSNRRVNPILSLYEVIEGTTRDAHIEVEGRTFAYTFTCDANSKTKREVAAWAAEELAKQIVATTRIEDDEVFDEDQIILFPVEA